MDHLPSVYIYIFDSIANGKTYYDPFIDILQCFFTIAWNKVSLVYEVIITDFHRIAQSLWRFL